ncbi:hypothetical protein ZYGR_0AD03180 [Zygosaccharomyces rouxii]|uniref:ZYRO0G13376p n=2 Tax=Zygosaccharomyces rouxii TaxID=4956 RepID=C5E0K0_ZYGRC|nr:uncharacterized protein ZYRO0G13376g [Zygosaccharomyces rouxii]KAH9202628.1 hypothetical protein LQ764DRAFT_232769 [Zygosaccharomyces rouxii]GAV51135.1 hypothetical protein ZYGR_0AD03180 [Zygosaccharomyces rouxii]CAR29634.1 ZYRO0G13376p [Zygosaccharomyces rouxii]
MSGVLQAGLLKKDQRVKDTVLVKLLESLICSICHDLMFVPVMTQCGHNYCYDCLSSWFDSNSNELSCPQCRASISDPPSLNSVLQQWLVHIIELVGPDEDSEEFKTLLSAKESSEKSYRFDEKNDLFGGVFKTSAMGVVDEDDDGILRCSNCHWELEDDVGDTCPHCNSRIRSRMSQPRRGGFEDEEDEEDGDEDSETGSDMELEDDISRSLVHYRLRVRELADTLRRDRGHNDRQLFMQGTTAAGVPFYFPDYALYLSTDYSLSEEERSRRLRLVRNLESELEEDSPNSPGHGHTHSYFNPRTHNHQYEDDEVSEDTDHIDMDYDDDRDDMDDMDDDHAPRDDPEGGIIDLEAEVDEDEDEGSGRDSAESGHDSDYYERHDGGFVSGDSLDDAPVGEDALEDEEDEDQEDQEDQEEDNSDDSHDRQESSHRRKRFHVVLDSEDE